MVSQLSNFSVLFLFISLSSGLNSERSYFDKYSGFPSSSSPFFPPKAPYFPPSSEWDIFKNFQMLEMLNEKRSMFNQLMDLKSEFAQFMQMKNAGLLPPFPNPSTQPFPTPSSSSFPTPPTMSSIPVVNTYLDETWKPKINTVMERPTGRLEIKNGNKMPIVVQMFEIPKRIVDTVQNSTKVQTSAVPEILGVNPVPGSAAQNPMVVDGKGATKTFVERITQPVMASYRYEMDLPKDP